VLSGGDDNAFAVLALAKQVVYSSPRSHYVAFASKGLSRVTILKEGDIMDVVIEVAKKKAA
jgi:hypothetical protein